MTLPHVPSRPVPPPPPSGPPLPVLPRLIAWLVILASIGVVLARGYLFEQPAPKDPARVPDAALQIQARYVVGMAHLLKLGPAQRADLARSMDSSDEPIQRLRLVSVEGELRGRNAALQALARLRQQGLPEELAPDADLLYRLYTMLPETGPATTRSFLTAEERDELLHRHGWFARLALAYEQPAGSPQRKAAMASAIRTAILLPVGLAGGCVLGLCGFVLLIVGLVLYLQRKLRVAPPPAPRWSTAYLEAFAVYLGSTVALGLLIRWLVLRHVLPGGNLLVSLLGFSLVPVALIYPWLRGCRWSDLREALSVQAPRGVWREVGAGIVGYIAGLPLVILGMLFTLVLTRLVHPAVPPTHPIINEALKGPGAIAIMLLLASVWAPITEELLFRGYLLTHLRRRLGLVLGAAVMACIFAAVHPQGLLGLPPLAILGFNFAMLRAWRGSILPGMVAHALNNTLATVFVVAALA